MKTVLKVLLGIVVLVVLLGAGGFVWARGAAATSLGRTVETHTVDFPVPFPLDSAEAADLELDDEGAAALALERARERGKHLVESRYVCVECHGRDFGGGVMVDDAMIGRLLGPNLTAGQGSRTASYTPTDWDRIVRHGVKPDGHPAAMPSEDFQRMSDRELSDIVAYIRSVPPVDAEVPAVKLGPLGTVLLATGQLPLSADVIGEHGAAHLESPPEEAVSVDFGRHLAGTCMGCHTATLTGGPIPGAPPGWPPAANLTPGPDGIGSWTIDDFLTAIEDGTRPDGTEIREPMAAVLAYMEAMNDTERRALWEFLRSVPAAASGG